MSKELTYEEKRQEILDRFKKLQQEAKTDIIFDKSKLGSQFDSTIKISRWIDKRYQWLNLYRALEHKRLLAWKQAYEFYKTEYNLRLETKEEIKNMILTDPNYSEIGSLCQLVSDIIDFIDSTIENLKQRQWEMKTFFEYLKFTHGD